MIADVKNNKAFVYIEDKNPIGDVTFPSQPVVISLKDLENIDEEVIQQKPTPGEVNHLPISYATFWSVRPPVTTARESKVVVV